MDDKDKKYEKDAEELVNHAFGAEIFERSDTSEVAKVVRKWEDQPALVKKNIAGSLEDKTKKVKKVEARKLKKLKKVNKDEGSPRGEGLSSISEENQKIIDKTFEDENKDEIEEMEKELVADKEKEAKIEKEKTATEILEEARGEFAKVDLMAEKYIRAKKKFSKEKKTKEDFEKDGGNAGKEYAEAKGRYFEALKARRAEILDSGSEKDIIIETIAAEANKLYDKKTELDLELRGGASRFEKVLNISKKVVEKYRKMPLKYKLMLSAGLLAGGVAAGAVGGAAGAAMVTGVVAGRWFQRVLGGSAAAVGLEGLIKRSQEKKAGKEVTAEFADKLMESIKNGDKKLDEKLLELEGGKKWEKYRRFALAGSMGALIASGWTAKALGNVIPHEWADWAKEKVGLGAEAAPTVENQGTVPAEGTVPEAKVVPESAPMETGGGFVEVAGKGDSVWKMAEEQLAKNYGEKFAGLDGARKTYLIDAIKGKIAADPGKFGLEDIDKIKVGQKIDFSSIFEDKAGMDEIFGDASALKQAALENITNNDKILGDWTAAHPGEELTSGKIDEILTNKGVEINLDDQRFKTYLEAQPELPEEGVDPFLENEMAHIKAFGFSKAEYEAIKSVKVSELLEKIPSSKEAWEIFNQPGGAKAIGLPSDGKLGAIEFNRQIKLAEFIRGFNPSANIKQMSVSRFLRTIN
ncbi:hypothetical protein KKG85_01415 [Patescibacteria group bacterium]|nr:hypothetical protein [Patescibacteria group bacterium]MBU2580056.1 hypothetical protein [Patescibacteria group bacterium]